jgi:hypothetical protein
VKTVTLEQVGHEELALPPRVQEALGELVGSAKEGLLALSVGVGLGVLAELMEEEVVEVVGPKGKHIAERVAVRHGHEAGEVTLGGRRVVVERPRVRTVDGEAEVRLATYEYFADRDPLSRSVLERMLAGVSTRRYRRTQEPVGAEVEQQGRSTSRSSVSRTFIERTRVSLTELMSRRLDDVRLAAMMIDGIDLGERTNVVALGITTEGVKIPLGLWEGSTENASVATALLSDLVERGLDPEQGILFVIDGAKGVAQGNPRRLRPGPRSNAACGTKSGMCSSTCPSASGRPSGSGCAGHGRSTTMPARSTSCARSPRSSTAATPAPPARCAKDSRKRSRSPGSVRGNLKRTLESTNPVESMIEIVRRTQRNVKRWSSGEMALRWTAAGMLEAQRQFRKIIGYKDLATLVIAIERDNDRSPRSHRRRSHPDQGDDYARHCLTVTPRPPPRNSTASETSSLNYLFDTRSIRAIANSNHSYFDDPVYNRNLAAATRLTGPPALHVSGARNASCATRHRRHRS